MSKKNFRSEPEMVTEVEETVAVETPVVEEPVAVPAEPVYGAVVCDKLNVRKKPAISAEVLIKINKGTKVKIDQEKSTKEWYKVVTKGVDGYCMKKFIELS